MGNSKILLIVIIVLTVAAAIFIYPQGPGNKYRPWRLGLDLVGGTHLIYEVDMSQVEYSDRDSVMAGLRDVIERRVNLFGVSEPQVVSAKEGDSYRLIVELAGIKDIKAAINEIGLTPFLDFREVKETQTNADHTQTDAESQRLSASSPRQSASIEFIPTDLTGRYVKGAQIDFNSTTGAPQVNIQFNDDGAKIFEKLTARNVNKPLAIFLDNNLIEMPVVQERISGGRAQITGKFTIDEARKMVERFNAGALPAPITLISQQTIGASLGQESLKKAIYAGALGTLVIVLFMLGYYRKLGIFASLALVIYIILTAAIFKLGITMSLAGIAGFILSIGMAVDANILIFERTKEEIKNGLSKISAIEEGFRRAWPSIRDSNISTIITSIILYYFTSSFIKGFALALLIGVLVSMFSAITITRTLMRVFTKDK
jgi:protein-export membrane protein SecD